MTAKDLTARQKRFVQTLLASKSAREAAHKCGIGEKTAYRWLRLPQVRSALAEAEGQILADTMRRLLSIQSGALEALTDLVADRRLPGARLQAARTILDAALKLRNAIELEGRLAELERKLSEVDNEHSPQD